MRNRRQHARANMGCFWVLVYCGLIWVLVIFAQLWALSVHHG